MVFRFFDFPTSIDFPLPRHVANQAAIAFCLRVGLFFRVRSESKNLGKLREKMRRPRRLPITVAPRKIEASRRHAEERGRLSNALGYQ